MRYRTIAKSPDTGRLDRAEGRKAVIALRERHWVSARPGTGTMVARETPAVPYGTRPPGTSR